MKIDVDYLEYKETIGENMKLVTKNHDLKAEVEKLKAIINKLDEKNKFLTEVANEKQNRIDRAMTYNNYLREKCSYRLNDGHLRKMKKILLGTETKLDEVPRMGTSRNEAMPLEELESYEPRNSTEEEYYDEMWRG